MVGADLFDGGSGIDKVSYDASGPVRADLLTPATNTGDAVGDRYISIENLEGSTFNDTLLGNNSANVIGGNSYHSLPSGQDQLFGRGGNDRLFGYDNNDVLNGGLGQDTMAGGSGADIFALDAAAETGTTATTRDVILDFKHLVDRIDLRTIDASTLQTGNNAFVWKGTAAITTSTAGEIRYQQVDNAGTTNDFTLIDGDTDADTAVEFQIHLNGLITLTSVDFLL